MFQSKTDLEQMVGKNDKVLWTGKPDKTCYFLEGVFNPMLPFALLWFLFDSIFIGVGIAGAVAGGKAGLIASIPIFAFLAIHLMPVWMYLAGVLLIGRKYKHAQFIVTDKGVYVSGGMFSYSCEMKPFTELARVNIHRGIIDQMVGVGDVVLTSNNSSDYKAVRGNVEYGGMRIEDIRDYQRVFDIIKKLQEDVYTDTMYPNDLRPAENHGYKTEYKGSGTDI